MRLYLYCTLFLAFLSSSLCSRVEAREGFVNNNGVEIFYTDHGSREAPPIVFIHGFPFSGKMWKCQIKDLKDTFRVITVDLRGFGRSGKNATDYSYPALVSDVRAVVEALHLENPAIAGHSLGSIVAELYTVTFSNEVSKLLLFSPFAGQILNDNQYTFGLDPSVLAPLIPLLPNDKPAFDKAFVGASLPETCSARKEILHFLLKIAAQVPANVELAIFPTVASNGVPLDVLSQITIPTAIFFGNIDILINKEGVYELNRLLPNSLLKEFFGGHMINITQSKAVNPTIRGFLEAKPNKCHTCL